MLFFMYAITIYSDLRHIHMYIYIYTYPSIFDDVFIYIYIYIHDIIQYHMFFNHTPIGTNQTKGNDIKCCIFCSFSEVTEYRTELRKGCTILKLIVSCISLCFVVFNYHILFC